MNSANRPVSPHIQIYRPQLTSVMSILHRISGVMLAIGAILFAFWISSLAYYPHVALAIFDFLASIPGRLFLFAWTLTLFYHLCNGIRHLFWDVGKGFEMKQVYQSGWITVAATLILTCAVWIVGYAASCP